MYPAVNAAIVVTDIVSPVFAAPSILSKTVPLCPLITRVVKRMSESME